MSAMALPYVEALQQERPGFILDSATCIRNRDLWKAECFNEDLKQCRHVKSTGTTIVGLLTKDAVILAADSRATAGPVVSEKDCLKLHCITDNIWMAGAGVAGDLDNQARLFKSQMALEYLNTGRQVRFASFLNQLKLKLFHYGGALNVGIICGGVDCKGSYLVNVGGDGNFQSHPFCANGSGMLAANSILCAYYKDGLSTEEGLKLAARAVRMGVLNDPYSGSVVNAVVIDGSGKCQLRMKCEDYSEQVGRVMPPGAAFPKGMTQTLKERVRQLRPLVQVTSEEIHMVDE